MVNSSIANVNPSLLQVTELEDLLNYLKRVWQVDLTGYKRSSLLRRIPLHMRQVGVTHYQDYLDYLEQQPQAVTHLLETVFINFTGFFRDRPVWEYLENQVIPQMIANKAPNEPIRIWSAGCASGEETYSLAILLAEALGLEQFRKRVQIYGTDVDHDAVKQAQKGLYSSEAVAEVSPKRLERYFERTYTGYQWRPDLHCPIMFYQHNLLQTAPLPRIDLLACRNMLIYLTPEAQIRALVRFHFSLRQTGFMLLGQSEALVTRLQKSLFTLTNQQARIFTKVADAHRDPYLLSIAFSSKQRPIDLNKLTEAIA